MPSSAPVRQRIVIDSRDEPGRVAFESLTGRMVVGSADTVHPPRGLTDLEAVATAVAAPTVR